MRKTRWITLVAAGMLLVFGAVWGLTSYYRFAHTIPAEIREQVMSEIHPRRELVWRVYRVIGDTTYVVADYTFVRDQYAPKSFTCARITKDRHDQMFLQEMGGKFEAADVWFTCDSRSLPIEQCVFGIAADKRISGVKAEVADGRIINAVMLDGFWWLSEKMNPDDYKKTLWTEITAVDGDGKVIYELQPDYAWLQFIPPQ